MHGRTGMNMGMSLIVVAVLALSLVPAAPAAAATITEFDANPGGPSAPRYITTGPEGNIWWTDASSAKGIYHMSPGGERFTRISTSLGAPLKLAVAPGGWISWTLDHGSGFRNPEGGGGESSFTMEYGGAVVLTPANEIRWGTTQADGSGHFEKASIRARESNHIGGGSTPEFFSPSLGNARVTGLAATPDGHLWAGLYETDRVRVLNAASLALIASAELPPESGPTGIAIGPEGDAWVAMYKASAVDRFHLEGLVVTRTRFNLPPGSEPEDIVLGADGAFWIVEEGTNKIGRMDTAGNLTNEYTIPTRLSGALGITAGHEGALWFTEYEAGQIGRLVPDPLPPPSLGAPPSSDTPPSSGSPPPPSPRDTVPPAFRGSPSLSPSRFAVANGAKARSSRPGAAATGSTLKFSLSETATVTVTVTESVPGRKSGRSCVAPGKAKPGAPKCTRHLVKGSLTLRAKSGANSFPFSGKLMGKALSPGSYEASLLAHDIAGNVSAPKSAAFNIVR